MLFSRKYVPMFNLNLLLRCLVPLALKCKPQILLRCTGYTKIVGAFWKLIIFTSMVNRVINTSSNERIIVRVYDTCTKMFDVCTLGHAVHIDVTVAYRREDFGVFKHSPKFRSFAKAKPNSQFRGIYIRNNLIRIRGSAEPLTRGLPT
jgi:type II secretory pathway component PulC